MRLVGAAKALKAGREIELMVERQGGDRWVVWERRRVRLW